MPRYQIHLQAAALVAAAGAAPAAASSAKAQPAALLPVMAQTEIRPMNGGFVIVTATRSDAPSTQALEMVVTLGNSVRIDKRILTRSARPVRSSRP